MIKRSTIIYVFIALSLILIFGCRNQKLPLDQLSENQSQSKPQYLIFQLFNYAPTPEGKAQPFDKKDIASVVDEIINKLGGLKGDGKTRQLGFAIGPLTLDHTDDELRQTIRESFEIAEEKNVAVVIHIDDSMFWLRRKDLWQDKNNVEWSDRNGTVHPHRWIGWAPTLLAPQMCYTSPSLRKEISRIAKEVIGGEIKKRVDDLKAKNKEHLFAGVIAGWETHLPDYRYLAADDQDIIRVHGKDNFPRKRIGYCALSNRGFSEKNPPKDFDLELEKVVHDWAEFWAKELNEAGVPKESIYTHFALPVFQDEKGILDNIGQKLGFKATSLEITGHARSSTAFNQYSRPGFSTYPVGFAKGGRDALINIILEEREKQGNQRWASAEGTNVKVESGVIGYTSGGLSWEEYLGGMFNNGASLVNIFAWQQDTAGPYGKATRSDEAIEAYKKFLGGEVLPEAVLKDEKFDSSSSSESLPGKIQKIQSELPQWIQKNPSHQLEIQSLMQKLDNYIKAGNTQEAEKIADEILKLIES